MDAAERKLAKIALEEEIARRKQLFAQTPVGIVLIDPSTAHVIEFNSIAHEQLGYTRAEFARLSVPDIDALETREETAERIRSVMREGKAEFDTVQWTKDKDKKHVHVIAQTVNIAGRTIYQCMWQDITDRKRVEEAIRASEQRYRSLSDIITDFAFSCVRTAEGCYKVDWIAGPVDRITGYGTDEIKERGCWKFLVHPEDGDIFERNITALQPGESSSCELRIIHHDGRVRWLHCRARAIEEVLEGRRHRLFGGVEDITGRKNSEEALNLSEKKIQESYSKLQRTLEGTIEAITCMSEMKDPYTAGHQRRVAHLACAVGKRMNLSDDAIHGLRIASLVHDIGKIQVPSEILTKPGKLNPIEFQMIMSHASGGQLILETVEFPWPVAEIVSQHHERIDGSGYPLGLFGDQILIEAKILAVADAVEAMASHRPYRAALGIDKALQEIQDKKGSLFDPAVVNACVSLFAEGFAIVED